VFWLRDEAQEDSANLPDPDVIAAEIAEDLRAALEQFEASPPTSRPPIDHRRRHACQQEDTGPEPHDDSAPRRFSSHLS
jgi:hypothetical protein